MKYRKQREALVRAGAHVAARGLAPGTSGNLSLKIDDGWLMTPTNASLGALRPKALSLLGADGEHLDGDPPTKERAFHRAVYEARPDCGAVVHLHSTYAVAFASLRHVTPENVLPPITPYSVMRLGRVALVEYARPGDDRLASLLGAAARDHRTILLANHGPVLAGASLEAAVGAAEELEETAKLFFVLHNHNARLLTPAQVAVLEASFDSASATCPGRRSQRRPRR